MTTCLVFNYHHLPLAEPFVSVPSREFFCLSEKKMDLIYRTGQPTKRRFFFLLSKLKLHVTGHTTEFTIFLKKKKSTVSATQACSYSPAHDLLAGAHIERIFGA